MEDSQVKKIVREKYGELAGTERSCCAAGDAPSCCSPENVSKEIGYKDDDLKAVPQGANLGLGCGNPVAIASLKSGETVLDLGSGAGFDCFLAANKVGKNGRVIGIDMTPEMIEKARQNAKKGSYGNVEFRLGEIENLPAADNSVDVVISNCVINLAPDKRRVFKEAFRVLRPGGRFMISDLVLTKELPTSVRESVEAYVGCVAGATKKEEYLESIREAGFHEIQTVHETPYHVEVIGNDPTAKEIIEKSGLQKDEMKDLAGSVLSIGVCGIKPTFPEQLKEKTKTLKREGSVAPFSEGMAQTAHEILFQQSCSCKMQGRKTMEKISWNEALELASPYPYVLAVTIDRKGKPNIIGLGWWTITSWDPKMTAISIGHPRYSHECIEYCGEFVLCFLRGGYSYFRATTAFILDARQAG